MVNLARKASARGSDVKQGSKSLSGSVAGSQRSYGGVCGSVGGQEDCKVATKTSPIEDALHTLQDKMVHIENLVHQVSSKVQPVSVGMALKCEDADARDEPECYSPIEDNIRSMTSHARSIISQLEVLSAGLRTV